MRLVIQIPAYNEQECLGHTLRSLPRQVEGFDSVLWVVVDDGSTDATIEVAKANGADRVASVFPHRGLADAFRLACGISLSLGADVIVNTDADNQYCADDISRLVAPIVANKADLVVGARPVWKTCRGLKRWLQVGGSLLISRLGGIRVPDCTSGFRAFTADAAGRLRVRSRYTYTLETLLLAGFLKLRVTSVAVRTNPVTRPSRLIKSVPGYLFHAAMVVLNHLLVHRFVPVLLLSAAVIAFVAGYALQLQQSHSSPLLQRLVETCFLGLCVFLFGTLCFKFGADTAGVTRRPRRRTLSNFLPLDQASPAAPIRKISLPLPERG